MANKAKANSKNSKKVKSTLGKVKGSSLGGSVMVTKMKYAKKQGGK